MITCPNCTGFLWRPGPCGGASQNMECVGCKARFNFGFFSAGVVVILEELPMEHEGGGHWRTDMFPEVLQ